MKNNYILLSLLVLSSCSQKNHFVKTGEIDKIEKAFLALSPKAPSRFVAESNSDSCLSDELTENRLVQEIGPLENSKSFGSKLIISGMDLSKFQPSQAIFLEKNKEWIHTQNLDLGECKDIKCVFSKIYPDSSGLEGYLNYYFYLKMGYTLSTENKIPEIDLGDKFSYRDTLFSKEELNNFYLLSKSLSPTFQKLPTLSSIHRMPKNTYIPKYGDKTCGLAGGAFNKGYIILMDKCLTRDEESMTAGNFFPLTTHEISHRLDYNILKNYARFSESQTWLDFSGWYIEENIDENTGKITSRNWKVRESTDSNVKHDGFIRDYAATAPAEDFADSVGYSRFTPEEMKKVAPLKFDWISKNLFEGKSFSQSGINDFYISFLKDHSTNALPAIINNCLSNNSSFAFNPDATLLSSFKDYDPSLVQCILGGIEHSITSGIRTLKASELEGCDYFKSNETLIKNRVLAESAEFIKKDLNKNVEIANQLKALAELISKLNEEIDPREIFISCQEEARSEECYNNKINASFDFVAQDFEARIPNQTTSFKQNYILDNRYAEINGRLVSLFGQIFNGSDLKFKEEAKRKWKQCYLKNNGAANAPVAEQEEEKEELLLSPFNGGTQYIKKSVLNCLNKSAPEELIAVLDKIGRKLSISISSQSTKKFILEMYINNYTSTFQSLVEIEAKNEKMKLDEIKKELKDKVVTHLTHDTSWVGPLALREEPQKQLCQNEAKRQLDLELEASFKSLFGGLSFHTIEALGLENQICYDVLNSSQIKMVRETNQTNAIAEALPRLKETVLERAQVQAQKCKNQFSRNDKFSLKSRNYCLTNTLRWNAIIAEALNVWISTEPMSFIPSAKSKGSEYLSNIRSELKETAIKNMN